MVILDTTKKKRQTRRKLKHTTNEAHQTSSVRRVVPPKRSSCSFKLYDMYILLLTITYTMCYCLLCVMIIYALDEQCHPSEAGPPAGGLLLLLLLLLLLVLLLYYYYYYYYSYFIITIYSSATRVKPAPRQADANVLLDDKDLVIIAMI